MNSSSMNTEIENIKLWANENINHHFSSCSGLYIRYVNQVYKNSDTPDDLYIPSVQTFRSAIDKMDSIEHVLVERDRPDTTLKTKVKMFRKYQVYKGTFESAGIAGDKCLSKLGQKVAKLGRYLINGKCSPFNSKTK